MRRGRERKGPDHGKGLQPAEPQGGPLEGTAGAAGAPEVPESGRKGGAVVEREMGEEELAAHYGDGAEAGGGVALAAPPMAPEAPPETRTRGRRRAGPDPETVGPDEPLPDVASLKNLVAELPVAWIHPDKLQPRKRFDEQKLQELALSIQRHGVLQPIVVTPATGPGAQGTYQIVAGERRWRAAQRAGLETIPAMIKTFNLSKGLMAQLVENLHREDLDDLEKADALFRLKQQLDDQNPDQGELTWEDVADIVALSATYVKTLTGLRRLEEETKEIVRAAGLTTRVSLALRPLPPKEQVAMAKRAAEEGLTAEQIREQSGRAGTGRTRTTPSTREPQGDALGGRFADAGGGHFGGGFGGGGSSSGSSLGSPGPALPRTDPEQHELPEMPGPDPEALARQEAAAAADAAENPVSRRMVTALEEYAHGVRGVVTWIEGRRWAPSQVTPAVEQALEALYSDTTALQQQLIRIRAGIRENRPTEAEQLAAATAEPLAV